MVGNEGEAATEPARQPVQVLVHPLRLVGWDWEFLLLRRLPSRGGFWQGVTGGVEGQESLADAARRELIEETRLQPIVLQSIDHSCSYPMDEGLRQSHPEVNEIEEHVFFAQVDGGSDPLIDPEEHDRFIWCRLEEAIELLHWPENKDALTRVEEHLRRHRARHER
ncbi:MAG: NUDIX pyrophosphatase [Candidatus Thermoplasmatota archaeon]|nr:NUDIX pyrophosphatase [Candidatus Thermoplasmatota archaeon]